MVRLIRAGLQGSIDIVLKIGRPSFEGCGQPYYNLIGYYLLLPARASELLFEQVL